MKYNLSFLIWKAFHQIRNDIFVSSTGILNSFNHSNNSEMLKELHLNDWQRMSAADEWQPQNVQPKRFSSFLCQNDLIVVVAWFAIGLEYYCWRSIHNKATLSLSTKDLSFLFIAIYTIKSVLMMWSFYDHNGHRIHEHGNNKKEKKYLVPELRSPLKMSSYNFVLATWWNVFKHRVIN